MKPSSSRMRSGRQVALLLLALFGLSACSGSEGDTDDPEGGLPNLGGGQSGGASVPSGFGVAGYDRPAGMLIGRAASGDTEVMPDPTLEGNGGASGAPSEDSDDVEIPTFETPDQMTAPCSGCVELNVDVNDINQRDDFVFNAGGVNVTRVVWSLIIPFNSDQLFVQPFVNGSYGTYTDLDANAFAVGAPVQLVHAFSGAATSVGIAIGSAGAWTGNMTMSVYVDSVTLEGADPSATRTFDTDVQGLATRSATNNPRVVYHP